MRQCFTHLPRGGNEFQHTHQPEGRCDDAWNNVFTGLLVSTHAPARRPVRQDRTTCLPLQLRVSTHAPARRPVRPDAVVGDTGPRTVSTHAPARRPVRHVLMLISSPGFKFQHTHQPEGRCDAMRRPVAASVSSFNTRTSPKAGATQVLTKRADRMRVSTHAPARRPVRRRHPWPCRAGSCFNTRTSPKAGATSSCRWGTRWKTCFNTRTSPKAGATRAKFSVAWHGVVSTHAPARRPVRPPPSA